MTTTTLTRPASGSGVPRSTGLVIGAPRRHLGDDPAEPGAHLAGADAALGRDHPAGALHRAVRLHLRRRHPDPRRRAATRTTCWPGSLALNLVTSTMGTAVGLSTDLHEGMIDRFRALPMWRPAVLVGRSMADLMTSFLCALIVGLTGLAVGWRPGANYISIVGGFAARAVLRLLADVDRRLRGVELEEPRIGGVVRLHRAVPAGLRLQRHGADPAHAGLAAGHRQLEPGERGRAGGPGAVGQPEPVRDDPGLADAASGRGVADLVGGDPGGRRAAGVVLLQARTTE